MYKKPFRRKRFKKQSEGCVTEVRKPRDGRASYYKRIAEGLNLLSKCIKKQGRFSAGLHNLLLFGRKFEKRLEI